MIATLNSIAIAEAVGGEAPTPRFALVVIVNLHDGHRAEMDFATRTSKGEVPDAFRAAMGAVAEDVAHLLTMHAEYGGGGARAGATLCQMPATSEGGTLCTLAFGHTGPHRFPPIGGGE